MLAKYSLIIQSLSEPEVSVKLKTIWTCTASSDSGSDGGYVSEYKELQNAMAKMHHQMLFVITVVLYLRSCHYETIQPPFRWHLFHNAFLERWCTQLVVMKYNTVNKKWKWTAAKIHHITNNRWTMSQLFCVLAGALLCLFLLFRCRSNENIY